MPPKWQALIDSMTNVQRLVHLAMRYDMVQEEAIRAEILKARKREYEATLTEMAADVGCDSRRAMLSQGDLLTELNEASKADGQSMANTYNYDLGVAIIAISTETPTANRNTYAKRLQTWEGNRAKWKNPQVALSTSLSARTQAQRDFARFNPGLADGEAVLIGPDPAAEPICQGWLNRGKVPAEVARRNPSPFHLGCPHFWEFALPKAEVGDCRDMWLGG